MRNVIKNILLVISLLAISACASSIMKGYVGKDITEVVLDYGQPASIIELSDNKRAYQWTSNKNYTSPVKVSTTGNTYSNIYTNSLSTNYNEQVTVSGGQTSNMMCRYTLYAEKQEDSWIVYDYRSPKLLCE